MKTIVLANYDEVDFAVSKKWLQRTIHVSLTEFKNSYTFDDSEVILILAKEQGDSKLEIYIEK